LTASFLLLAVMFVLTGVVYYGVNHTAGAPATVVMVALCHFLFNFGTSCVNEHAHVWSC
jgi:PHS family inorganic phosphate transporter-like MFS transporter